MTSSYLNVIKKKINYKHIRECFVFEPYVYIYIYMYKCFKYGKRNEKKTIETINKRECYRQTVLTNHVCRYFNYYRARKFRTLPNWMGRGQIETIQYFSRGKRTRRSWIFIAGTTAIFRDRNKSRYSEGWGGHRGTFGYSPSTCIPVSVP